jgi:hypothetical protein
MKRVEIPFMGRFQSAMIEGRKTLTTRSKKYGDVGDRFYAFGVEFEITSIAEMKLADVALLWKQEGVDSQGEFMRVWSSLHYGVWNPNREVYVHGFKRVKQRGSLEG